MNVPKFLQEDLKLFSGIVSDLFPTIKEEETDYGILDKALRQVCEKSNLKDVDGEPLAPALTVLGWPSWCSRAGEQRQGNTTSGQECHRLGTASSPCPSLVSTRSFR